MMLIRKALPFIDVDKLNKRLFFDEYVRLNTFFLELLMQTQTIPIQNITPKFRIKEVGWKEKKENNGYLKSGKFLNLIFNVSW